jgi:hypothetical protein
MYVSHTPSNSWCNGLNGMDQPRSRQGRLVTPLGVTELESYRVRELGGGYSRVEGVSGAKHCMHDNGEFAGDSDLGAFSSNETHANDTGRSESDSGIDEDVRPYRSVQYGWQVRGACSLPPG